MIIPQYWAEGRAQHKQRGKQITVRRFGWSDLSQEEAQANADQRSNEALQRLISGEKLQRRELKVPYNGADGLPIREEIISRHGDTIITRNSYGSLCLNTPNVLFVDIDFPDEPPFRYTLKVFVVLALLSVVAGQLAHSVGLTITFLVLSLLFSSTLSGILQRIQLRAQGGIEQITFKRVHEFLAHHPEWNLRIYKTPAGMRLLATHRNFTASDPLVQEIFTALGADPMYVAMCRNQQCFRARVSPKPWRIGIHDRLKPRHCNWPVEPERMPQRLAWIDSYEKAAQGYAACTFLRSEGSGSVHLDIAPVIDLHDEMCGATSQRPIA